MPYKDPSEGTTTFISYTSPLTAEDKAPNWIDAENIQIENAIRTMKRNGKWDYKLGTAIHGRSYWEGPPDKTGHVVYVAPQKTFTIQELSDKVQELEAKLDAALTSPVVEKNKPKSKVRKAKSKEQKL